MLGTTRPSGSRERRRPEGRLALLSKLARGRAATRRAAPDRSFHEHGAHGREYSIDSQPAIIPLLVARERDHDHGGVGFEEHNLTLRVHGEVDAAIVEAEHLANTLKRREAASPDRARHVL